MNYDRTLQIIGHVFFLILLLLGAVFFRERLLNFDSAFYSFSMLYYDDFYIAHDRYISYATQWIPLLALKLGCSLKTFLVLYSISLILLHYVIYNILVYGFKNTAAGIFLALSLVLAMRYKFYAGIAEVTASIGLLALFIGWVTKEKDQFPSLKKWQDSLIALLLIGILTTGHPAIAMPLFIFFGFDVIYRKRWKDLYNWGIIALATIIYYLKFAGISQKGGYESDRMSRLEKTWEILANLQDYYVWHVVKMYFETQYTFPFIIFIGVVGVLFWKRKWLSGIYIIIAFLGFMSVIYSTYSYLGAPIFNMIDGYLAMLGIIWALPMYYLFLRKPQIKWLNQLIVVSLLVFSVHRIYLLSDFFQKRLTYLETIFDNHANENERKLLSHMKDFDWELLWYPWSTPFETILLTSLDDSDNAGSLYYRQYSESKKFDERLNSENLFLGAHFGPFQFEAKNIPSQLILLKKGRYKEIHLND